MQKSGMKKCFLGHDMVLKVQNWDLLLEEQGEFMLMTTHEFWTCPVCGISIADIDYDNSTATNPDFFPDFFAAPKPRQKP